MQTKYGEQAILINRPKKNRNYLVGLKSPYNNSQPKSYRYMNTQKNQQKQVASKLPNSEIFKSELLQLVSITKNKNADKGSLFDQKKNIFLNAKYFRKSNVRLDIKNYQQRSHRQLSQVSLGSDGVKDINKHLSIQKKIVFPFNQIQRQQNHKSDKWKQRNAYHIRNSMSNKKVSDQNFYLKPKYRSLNKRSMEQIKRRSIKKGNQKDSFIQGFVRQKKLGKGGFATVWQALQIKSNKHFAVKQIDGLNIYQTHLTQINFSTFFFKNGAPKKKFQEHPGIRTLLTLHSYHIKGQKAFIVYQHCTAALCQILFDIYDESELDYSGMRQKSYILIHRPIYQQLKESCQFLKNLIYQITQGLALLEHCNIVHSDIKTSNILINISENKKRYSFKLIDYGSSFFFENLSQYRLATPQYMPPELINYLNKKKGNPYFNEILDFTKQYENISAIDIWGLGCILVQIIHGIPLWLNTKVKIKVKEQQKTVCGKFATESRSYCQILKKELELINNIDNFLVQENHTGVALDAKLRLLISKMLTLDPQQRIRPRQVLQILQEDCEYNYL